MAEESKNENIQTENHRHPVSTHETTREQNTEPIIAKRPDEALLAEWRQAVVCLASDNSRN